jgi:hypothetical protein
MRVIAAFKHILEMKDHLPNQDTVESSTTLRHAVLRVIGKHFSSDGNGYLDCVPQDLLQITDVIGSKRSGIVFSVGPGVRTPLFGEEANVKYTIIKCKPYTVQLFFETKAPEYDVGPSITHVHRHMARYLRC